MRFERIDAYDIDPLASHLMSWRVGKTLRRHGVAVHHHRQDALATLDVLLDQHPKACLWFDNLLGQHRYRVRDEARAEQELTALKTQLVGRHWGSIHDLLSGPTGDNTWTGRIATLTRDGLDVTRMDSPHTQALLRDVAAQNVWIDHLTSQVFPDHTATRLIPWAFKDRYCHWLQAGWVAAS
jgi:hypothetical protein